MLLYYTGTEEGSIPTISFEPKRAEINATIRQFDKIVQNSQDSDFSKKSASGRICENCDFRWYCRI
jgi:DNA helicase-2/ATP-dependent DNA helicase PcrA